jgi:hypothetical protein
MSRRESICDGESMCVSEMSQRLCTAVGVRLFLWGRLIDTIGCVPFRFAMTCLTLRGSGVRCRCGGLGQWFKGETLYGVHD